MKNNQPISSSSPVSLIPGIGDVRSKALAELDIYSIQDFLEYTETEDEVLHVAGKIGMRTAAILEIRSLAEKELQKSKKFPAKTGRSDKRIILYGILALANISMILAGVVVEATSYYHTHHPTYTVTALFKELPSFESYYEMRVFSTYKGTNVSTQVLIVDQFDLCFGDKSLTNIPEGILFDMLTGSELSDVTATIHVVEQKTKEVEEGWVTMEDAREISFPLSVRIENISHLENYPGINLIIWINTDKLADIRLNSESIRHSKCHFNVNAKFIDYIDANIFDPYRKGTVSVLPFIYYDEAKYFGIEDLPNDGLGPMLKLEKRDQPSEFGYYQVEYFWTPGLQGEFIHPDDLIGARQFYDHQSGKPIQTAFSYNTDGAQWLPFIAGIIGLQAVLGAVQFVKKKFGK